MPKDGIVEYKGIDIDLLRALHQFRENVAAARYGPADDDSYALIMCDRTLSRLVVGAREHKINTIDDMRRETKWARSDELGNEVLAILHHFHPIVGEDVDNVQDGVARLNLD